MHIALIPPHDPAQPRPWLPQWDGGFDYETAHGEGWTISEAAPCAPGQPGIQLQRLDSPEVGEPVFADDRDAWTHVVQRAREGSALHRLVLTLIDPVERCMIEGLQGSW